MWCWYWCHCGLPSWQDLWLGHQWVCISFLFTNSYFPVQRILFHFFEFLLMLGTCKAWSRGTEEPIQKYMVKVVNRTKLRSGTEYASSDATMQFKTINIINLCLEMVNIYETLCAWLTRKLLLSAPVLGFYLSVMLTELHKVLLLLWKPILIYFILIEEIC